MNRTLTDMISMYIDEKHQNWDEILPFVTFAYNSSVQETTGYCPYFLIHGREPLTFLDSTFDWPEVPPKPGDFDNYISNLLTIVEESKNISMARTMARQDKSKQVYDKHRREVNFSPDDLVLIWTPIRKVGRADKLQKNYIGPFKITRKTSPVNYEVKEVTGRGKKIVQMVLAGLRGGPCDLSRGLRGNPQQSSTAVRCQRNKRTFFVNKDHTSKPLSPGGRFKLPKVDVVAFSQTESTERLNENMASKEICEVEGIVNIRTASKWFKRFREGDISLEDKPRMGRSHVMDIETL
ncbi:K02A2.6-like [Cordylochernes scorpioides]|uniref:K02A2.6-like n=1 Tax=Cordylochernes scorpioides TaxID=51811 RepID=A0ABY6KXQ9_9ARAC|nr:K02A2.6-like [Cordylochernes scorpioides]